jgi:hypothetical protein
MSRALEDFPPQVLVILRVYRSMLMGGWCDHVVAPGHPRPASLPIQVIHVSTWREKSVIEHPEKNITYHLVI